MHHNSLGQFVVHKEFFGWLLVEFEVGLLKELMVSFGGGEQMYTHGNFFLDVAKLTSIFRSRTILPASITHVWPFIVF